MIQENQKTLNKLNVVIDIAILLLSLSLAYFYMFSVLGVASTVSFLPFRDYLEFFLVVTPIQLLINYAYGLYYPMRSKRFYQQAILILKSNTLFIGIILTILYTAKMIHFSRWVFVYFYFIYTFSALLKRYILHKTLHKLRSYSRNLKNIIVIGSGTIAQEYIDAINIQKNLGYRLLGYVSDERNMNGLYLGDFSELEEILVHNKAAEVVSALDVHNIDKLERVVSTCEEAGNKLSIIPFYYNYISSKPYIDQINNIPLLNIRRVPLDNVMNEALKRTLDIFGSLFLIILFSPIMLFAAIGLKLTTRESIIFKQKRVGQDKKEFIMYKFRSMRSNATEDSGWSTNNDPRKTKFGAFLRKCSIDEMPQFFNVLKGDMSLVGPRPEIPHYVDNFKGKIPLYMVKHQVKPGITGWAQVHGFRGDTSIKKRIEHDIYYIENWNIVLDIYILAKTLINGLINDEKL